MATDTTDRWCILRTSPGRTLALATSLATAGFDVWTPTKVNRRTLAPGRKNERRIDIASPILPGFAFARAAHLTDLAVVAADDRLIHPPFSVFRHAGRIPLVADRDVRGLQDAERAATVALQSIHDAETREEAERIRIAAIKSENARVRATRAAEHERRQALRSERRSIQVGTAVVLADAPSFAGMTGVVESTDGRTAVIAFGGALTMTVEAWQVSPTAVHNVNPAMDIAA